LGQITTVVKETVLLLDRKPAQVIGPVEDREPLPASFWQRLATRVRSWFEIPFGYEDEDGFHYGHEPVPHSNAARSTAPKVFTDRACDAMLSPSPVPPPTAESPVENPRLTV
jgi:hypothetical protein